MPARVKPGAFLKRGMASVSPETIRFLIENVDAIEALHDDLDTRRNTILAVTQASQDRLEAAEAAEADLVRREGLLADGLEDLEARERTVEQARADIIKAGDDLTNGLHELGITEAPNGNKGELKWR